MMHLFVTFSDEADWELTCVGHWDEDWNSYLITWDPEDVTSAFRCWVGPQQTFQFTEELVILSRSCLRQTSVIPSLIHRFSELRTFRLASHQTVEVHQRCLQSRHGIRQ